MAESISIDRMSGFFKAYDDLLLALYGINPFSQDGDTAEIFEHALLGREAPDTKMAVEDSRLADQTLKTAIHVLTCRYGCRVEFMEGDQATFERYVKLHPVVYRA